MKDTGFYRCAGRAIEAGKWPHTHPDEGDVTVTAVWGPRSYVRSSTPGSPARTTTVPLPDHGTASVKTAAALQTPTMPSHLESGGADWGGFNGALSTRRRT